MADKSLAEILGGATRFGRLTVLGEGPPYKWKRRSYRMVSCRCDCGRERVVSPAKLISGQTVSCGCFSADRASANNRTHGLSRSTEYRSWGSMIQRCTNPNAADYGIYGARGITICDRWRSSFEAFTELPFLFGQAFHRQKSAGSIGKAVERLSHARLPRMRARRSSPPFPAGRDALRSGVAIAGCRC